MMLSLRVMIVVCQVLLAWHCVFADNIAPKSTEYNENPTAENLAARELFHRRAFGLFVHYGLYSVSGCGEWQMCREAIPAEKYYAERLPHFKPKNGCVDEWIALAKTAGMKYIVLTTRHHEGYWLGDDFIREYTTKVRNAGLGVGVYYSVADWSDPGCSAGPFDDPDGWKRFVEKTHAQLRHLMGDFGKIEYLFYDGCPPPEEWNLDAINAEMRRLQPWLLVCRGFRDCDFKSCEGNANSGGAPLWESCYTFNRSWGYNRYDFDFKSPSRAAEMFFAMRHDGGNFLLNVGPMADGTVQREAVERLVEIGRWIRSNEEAVFDIVPHPFNYAPRELMVGGRENPSVAYWMSIPYWIHDGRVVSGISNKVTRVSYLATGEEIPFAQDNSGKTPRLVFPKLRPTGLHEMPYVVKIEFEGAPVGVKNEHFPKFKQ